MCWVGAVCVSAWAVLGLVAPASADIAVNITIVRLQLSLEEEYSLQVDRATEYILQFVPTAEQSLYPSRLWVRSGGGDAARPTLLTARQRTGATTWQLPYHSGENLLYELERMLCPDNVSDETADPSDCEDPDEEQRRGEFSLHVGSSCVTPYAVTLRVAVVRDWTLQLHSLMHTSITQASPRVYYYRFREEQNSVRLILESEDDVCATIAVQPCACPIAESPTDIEAYTLRMTMQRSGGAHLSRSRFPSGFYVISMIDDTDVACSGVPADMPEEDHDWLWEEALASIHDASLEPYVPPTRVKHLSIQIKSSLSRGEYWVGAGVALVVFLLFYVMFGLLIAAERWTPWRRLVEPLAVLAKPETGDITMMETGADSTQRSRRRASDATFDSSDNSDTDSEDAATAATMTTAANSSPATEPPSPATEPSSPTGEPSSPGTNGASSPQTIGDRKARQEATASPPPQTTRTDGARPFGLPAVLHVGALARRRARVLRARSDRYLYTLCTVAVFYALPVVQFVAAFQVMFNVSGSLDLCYYNFLCAHPLGALADFNHVYSNLGYMMLGALLLLQLRRRKARRNAAPRDEEYGIPQHYGLLSSMGVCMMVVAVLSASYHVCPNRLNFQFDTAFMYVLAVLSMVKIYQSRHADINARAHATFAVLAVLIALVVWGVLGGGPVFWSVFTVVHIFTFLMVSLQIYYLGQFRLEKASLVQTARSLRISRPLYTSRLVALLLANTINWAFAIYGLATQPSDMASHLLSVLLCNVLVYMSFYMCMKVAHGERVRWYVWAHLGGAAAAWAPAVYFFTAGSTDWASSPALSRHLNHECRVLQFYDAHDLWHALSAVALYLTFNTMLTWDDGLSAVRRTDIAVF